MIIKNMQKHTIPYGGCRGLAASCVMSAISFSTNALSASTPYEGEQESWPQR